MLAIRRVAIDARQPIHVNIVIIFFGHGVLCSLETMIDRNRNDALSSVDTATEERILQELRGVMRGRTSILISHRVSTVRNADRIAVLHQGRIVELGSHDELIARNGYYTELYNKQLLEEELAEV